MGLSLLIILSVGLMVAVAIGRRNNQRRAQFYLSTLEQQFLPVKKDYAVLGRDLGFGFDYTLEGPIKEVQGVLTLLPRYTPLYIPIARAMGRQDLLKLTFHCGDSLPAGVGALVHTNCKISRWSSVEHDEDWREERVEHGGQVYTLYFFNPIIAERLRSFLPQISSLPNLNQITVDSRRGKITIFLTPQIETLHSDVPAIVGIVFSLTGR